ncbi:50S ribosome-binding GTPase [Streptomyces sp. LP05-1]|uniref:50S ribosome-binding GTPase n=1 Tax=Streptomyces pyxinae TaxID=2970734 RepID=A0ABT2CMF3_9ACTN|nr:GTPase [Streptomyces sp. LP05-1]MCS0638598.1 50S ribosome-binding GTPase [Streptomyces sp. LP05-1]
MEPPLPDLVGPLEEPHVPIGGSYGGGLRHRLDALRELLGLSTARLDAATLDEAGRVLDEAAARQRLSARHTVVAIAGATGSGKSSLINALAGVPVSETGLRRPTTAAPIACVWSEGAAGLLDRLAIPGRLRRLPLAGGAGDEALQGLVLVDLPDHDSAVTSHRDQVDRVLALVDAVIWVVDPEKYADAALHERYLRPLAGHAEVTFVVLNQIDRLPGDAALQVLDDLRRLLDEDGMALGEHGEPGATVLAVSALTGEGVAELKDLLGTFVQSRTAAARRLSADVDAAAARLRPVYVADGHPGLDERARADFAARLAVAVGATAAGEAAEREWRRNANRACGTPWLRLWRWYERMRTPGATAAPRPPAPAEDELTARQRVEQAVRIVADEAAHGLPAPWAQAVREAAVRGAHGLPEALDRLATAPEAAPEEDGRPERGGRADGRRDRGPVKESRGGKRGKASKGGKGGKGGRGGRRRERDARDARDAEDAGRGLLPGRRRGSGRGSVAGPGQNSGARGGKGSGKGTGTASGKGAGAGRRRAKARPLRPAWWPAAVLAQASMTLLQLYGALWLAGQVAGVLEPALLPPVFIMLAGIVGGPLVEWACAVAARGPARRYGQETERRLREAAGACGRAMVLDPVAGELMRYREVREQYATVAGARGRTAVGTGRAPGTGPGLRRPFHPMR